MKTKTAECLMCHRKIEPEHRSFEQRLVDDMEFCRDCWDGIMSAQEEEVLLPVLAVVA